MKSAMLVLVALAYLSGCGGGVTDKSQPALGNPDRVEARGQGEKEKIEIGLPLRVVKGECFLTEDCVLNLGRSPYFQAHEDRKSIYATTVKLLPTRLTNVSYEIRPTGDGLTSVLLKGNKIVEIKRPPAIELLHEFISLPKLLELATEDGKTIIAGGKDGDTLGGEVVTKVVKKGSKIMPCAEGRGAGLSRERRTSSERLGNREERGLERGLERGHRKGVIVRRGKAWIFSGCDSHPAT